MTDTISEPAREWEYRGFTCRLYRLGDITLLGYVEFGDEWVQVLETEDFKDDDGQRVEDEVDRIIRTVVRDESDDGIDIPTQPTLPDVEPYPQPFPDDDDDPLGPNNGWMLTNGAVSVETTDGGVITVSVADIDAEDITADGLYDGDRKI